MGDVTALASRVVVIDGGTLRFDGRLAALVERHTPVRRVRLSLRDSDAVAALPRFGAVDVDGVTAVSRCPGSVEVATRLLAELDVEDLAIEDPPIEDVVRAVFDDG